MMNMNKNIDYDCIIIGSGPAGLTAAIYGARANIKTIVIAGDQPGGQLTITPMVDNYSGFPNGIGGFKLMMDMQNQVKNFGVEIKQATVKKLIKKQTLFGVELESGEVLKTKSIIIATGAKVKWLNLADEKRLIGYGISSCATCDGMFYKDKVVAVVGGGDTACEEAAFLTKFTKKVYMIHRREEFRASIAEQKKVLNNPKIEILWNSEVKELIANEKLEAIKIINNKSNKETKLKIDGLFEAVGYNPATKFLEGLIELREGGQIIVGKNKNLETMTNIEGIFAAGDCVNRSHRQAIIAAGDGSRAALDVQKWIREKDL